jgi:DNA-binding winged helix-turn-helix (wHTH) protein
LGGGGDAMAETELLSGTVVEFREFRVDLARRRVYRSAVPIKLTPKPFGALGFLLVNRHRVVSREELLQAVWGGLRGTNTVEQAISQLRHVLGDNAENPRYIETVPGEGYRWIADVRVTAGSVPAKVGEEEAAAEGAGVAHKPLETEIGRITENGHPRSERRQPARWLLVVAAGIATILVSCIGLFVAFHYFQKPPHLARVTISGDTLLALDATGRELWRYVFDGPVRELRAGEGWRVQIADLKDDGNPEVLVAVYYAPSGFGPGKEEVFCFSARGQVVWRYRPERHMEFRGGGYGAPWALSQMLVVSENRTSSIWVAVNHGTWWPAYIVKLSPAGAPEIVFTSSGCIYALHRVQTKTGNYILAAGVNNEYNLASLAILAEHSLPSTSPQSDGSAFQCIRGCPTGRPYRYILLPRSELNLASIQPYNQANGIRDRVDGVTVQTVELDGPSVQGDGVGGFMKFSQDLQPESFVYGDNYPQLHRRAETLGWIKHSFDNCPERRSRAVLRIADENGKWSRVEVPRVP